LGALFFARDEASEGRVVMMMNRNRGTTVAGRVRRDF